MIFRKTILLALILLLGKLLAAAPKDTVSVMVYNLLFYGHYTSFCRPDNNNIDNKDEYLRTIFDHTTPDLFAVNEMGPSADLAARILNNVINREGAPEYAHAEFTNTAGSNLVNMLFFNTEKFTLYDEAVIAGIVRDINLYSLYYNDPELDNGADTVFVHLVVAHLKAGSRVGDQQTREQEIKAVLSGLTGMDLSGSIVFMGDFNMNSSYEQAYQLLTYNPHENIRFYDPIDSPGVWFNNPEMALYHTQSPRTDYHDCFVSGGLDDRYDQIIVTSAVMDGTHGLRYLEDSYKTIGQDGHRFNKSLIDPPNQSEPPEVIDALYNMSDHLPVKLRMVVTDVETNVPLMQESTENIYLVNVPGSPPGIILEGAAGMIRFEIYTASGRYIKGWKSFSDGGLERHPIDTEHLTVGVYLIRVTGENMIPYSEKFIIY